MDKPKWQRARVVKSAEDPWTIGRELWVEIVKPKTSYNGRDVHNHKLIGLCPNAVPTNLRLGEEMLVWNIACLELLARDESDFANEVPIVTWEQFVESHTR